MRVEYPRLRSINFQSDWFQDQSDVMDYLDLDEVEEVPDTPERYICVYRNDANNTGNRSDGSSSCREYFNERFRNEPREKEKSVNIPGNRRLFVRPDNASNSPGFTIGNSPSCKNILSTLDNARHERGKSLCNSSSFVDLTEHSGRSRVFRNATSAGDLGTAGAYQYKKHLYSGNGVHAIDALDMSSKSSGLNNTIKVGPKCDREKGVAVALSKDESDSSSFASSSIRRESDVPQCNNSDISRKPSTSRSTRNKNRHAAGTSDPVIAIDVLSPENGIHSSNEDSSNRALQLEADLTMALEMQENEYNKMLPSTFGSEEMDLHHALAMQQESSSHVARAGGRPGFRSTSRGTSVPNLNPNPRQTASRNFSNNRQVQEQAYTSSRTTRSRGQFPGRPRPLSSSSMFSPNMNIEMRMRLLEALEAINDMEQPNEYLSFNDMEMPYD